MFKVYRDILVKGYQKFPYQKLTGRMTLLYSGRIVCGLEERPADFSEADDLYIDCDCDFAKWKSLQRVLGGRR